ncbi:hypothetical protein [Frankia gtarii]|uniref:hypothetical protein n=1 Tax=Frankia gtarii TaxID=2950102 RepID=UPI0021BEF7D7|nr:hypothetical protein [Frankia gtarii]
MGRSGDTARLAGLDVAVLDVAVLDVAVLDVAVLDVAAERAPWVAPAPMVPHAGAIGRAGYAG